MKMAVSVLLLATSALRGAEAPPGPLSDASRRSIETARDAALKGTGAAGLVRSLSDEVGARLAGSAGDRAAVDWAVRKLKEIGLENVHSEKVTVHHWERGEESGEVTAPVVQKLVLTALGNGVGTPTEGLEAEVLRVGSIVDLKALLEKSPEAARGKIVYFGQKMERLRAGKGYGDAVPIRVAGATEAARGGAVGVLIRSVGTNTSRVPHTGVLLYDDKLPKIPAAALSPPDADLLDRLSAGPGPLRVRFRLGCQWKPDEESANVIGEVRGSSRPEEIVLLGAHLDSWDLGTGALDDAAGVGIVSEAARRIAKLPRRPARTLRVVLFANEENGSAGSRGYEEAHKSELSRHVAATELDLGTDPVWQFDTLAGPEAEAAATQLAALLSPLGISRSATGYAGADIDLLRVAGVPLFGLHQDASRYFDYHHTADDTFDKIDPGGLDRCVAATLTFALYAAEVPGGFGRLPEALRKTEK
jgi:carboxypeptidase Q